MRLNEMKPTIRKKIVQSALLLALCAIAGALVLALIKHRSPDSTKTRETMPPTRAQSGDKSVIRGLRYSASMSEEGRLFVDADEFRIGKKKIGFLRVSLLNEAEIRNARIRIVRTTAPSPPAESDAPQGATSQAIMEKGEARDQTTLLLDSAKALLNEIESSKGFPGMSSTRIISIKIAPIDFQILEGNASMLRISAGQAGFDLKNRKVVFRDQVHASAGKESWRGDELSIDPASGSVTGKSRGEAKAQGREENLSRVLNRFEKGEEVNRE